MRRLLNFKTSAIFGILCFMIIQPVESKTLIDDIMLSQKTSVSNYATKNQIEDASSTNISLEYPQGVVWDRFSERVFVTDKFLYGMVAFKGNSNWPLPPELISSDDVGKGSSMYNGDYPILDSDTNRIIYSEGGQIMAVNLTNGNRTSLGFGSGPYLMGVKGLALDNYHNRVLAATTGGSGQKPAIMSVDLSSGDKSFISNDKIGSGPELRYPVGVALDPVNNRLLVVDSSSKGALLSVDLNTGNRTIISNDSIGKGISLYYPRDMVLDSKNNRALIAMTGSSSLGANKEAIVAVDLSTGNRTIISNFETGRGPIFGSISTIDLDSVNNRLFVTGHTHSSYMIVDLTNGNRSRPDGVVQNLASPRELVLDEDNNRFFVLDNSTGSIIDANVFNGEQTIALSAESSYTYNLSSTSHMALDIAKHRFLATDSVWGYILSADLKNGVISGFYEETWGSFKFMAPRGIVLNQAAHQALIVDSTLDAVVALDVNTSQIEILSDSNVGTGINFSNPTALVLDAQHDRVLVIDSDLDALVAVDLSSGDRTIISNKVVNGIQLNNSEFMVLDSLNQQVFVTDSVLGTIFAISLESGERVALTHNDGVALHLPSPTGIALDMLQRRLYVADAKMGIIVPIELNDVKIIMHSNH